MSITKNLPPAIALLGRVPSCYASSARRGYWPEFARDWVHAQTAWRSLTASPGNEHLILDLGVSLPFTWAYLGWCNFPTVHVYVSADAVTWGFIPVNAQVVPASPWTGRRQQLFRFASTTGRYVRFTPQGTPDGGAAYYEIGVAGCGDAIYLLPLLDFPHQPHQIALHTPTVQTEFLSGAQETVELGPPYVDITVQNPAWTVSSGVDAQLSKIENFPLSTAVPEFGTGPFVYTDNSYNGLIGNDAFLVRQLDRSQTTRQLTTLDRAVTYREVT